MQTILAELDLAPAAAASKKKQSIDDLLAAGIAEIAAHGIDRVTVANITKLSGSSRTTFYTYFGDLPGLFAEIWVRFGRSWLASKKYGGKELYPALNIALLDIFTAGHRIPEVIEVVHPDCEDWWRDQISGAESNALNSVWTLATKIGSEISASVTAGARGALQLLPAMQLLTKINLRELFFEGQLSQYQASQIGGLANLANGFQVQVTDAAFQIVAQSGYSAASVSRVARKLRVTSGSVYPRFSNIEQIIELAFDQSIRQVVETNTASYAQARHAGDFYGEVIIGALSEQRRYWRNFRLELLLESRVNQNLAQKMRPGIEETNKVLSDTVSIKDVPESFVEAVSSLMQTLAVGFSVLHNSGIPVDSLDHRKMTNHLIQQLASVSA